MYTYISSFISSYIIKSSNYIFLFLITIFFILSLIINRLSNKSFNYFKNNKNNKNNKNLNNLNNLNKKTNNLYNLFIFYQRIIIILFHTLAFYVMGSVIINKPDNSFIIFYIFSTAYLIFANIVTNYFYKGGSKSLWNNIFFMVSLGCVILYKLNPVLAFKQLIWYYIGLFICIIIFNFVKLPKILSNLNIAKNFYLILGLFLLLATLIAGDKDFGAKNWLTILGITFQPSEVTKLLFILYLSSCFSKSNLTFKNLVFPTIMSMIFILCLVFQNDLGSALLFFITYLCLIYVSYNKIWVISLSLFLFAIACDFAYNTFNHVKVRVDVWSDPWSSISTTGYQITQSLFAIASYGFMGSGLNKGYPNKIPVVERDLIFSAICEEFGVLFAIVLILVLINTVYICFSIAINSSNQFLKLLSLGIINLMCFQSFLTLGGSINLIPLTGVTLPFVSYGGSSVIVSFISIALLQAVYKNNEY